MLANFDYGPSAGDGSMRLCDTVCDIFFSRSLLSQELARLVKLTRFKGVDAGFRGRDVYDGITLIQYLEDSVGSPINS